MEGTQNLPARFWVVTLMSLLAAVALAVFVLVADVDFSWWYWIPVLWFLAVGIWGATLYWLRSSDIFDPEDPLGGAGLMDMEAGFSHVTKKRPGSGK